MERPPAAQAGQIQVGDLHVNRMGFGAMRVTGAGIWGEPPDREAAKKLLRRAVDLGVNFIDTADSYGPEVSENIIAEALHPYPDDVVVGTKGGLTRPGPGRWEGDCRPEHLRRACEGSLQRLRVETIDVYQLHTVDRSVPYEESLGVLVELRNEGKIRHVGVSNVDVEHFRKAREIADAVSVQNRYSVADRQSEDVLDEAEREDVAFLPWYPLAAGALSERGGEMGQIARDVGGVSPAQLVLAWLLHRSPKMLVIPGTSSIDHLEENVGAATIELTNEDLSRIERAVA